MSLSIGKKMGLNTFIFSMTALIPFIILGVMAVRTAHESFIQNKFDQLVSIREIKKTQVEDYFKEREGDMGGLVETASTLRNEAFNKLTAVREIKRTAVERYFQGLNDQILTFSEDRMVIDAMRQFRVSFRSFINENATTATDLKSMRQDLFTYYTGEFASEYSNRNSGLSPDVEQHFSRLDDDSIALQYHYIRANKHPLGSKHLLDRPKDSSRYSELHSKVHPIIRNYLEKFGYYDIFLVDPDSGDIVYSVFKELDYSTSLKDGPYADTNFGQAFKEANDKGNKDTVVLVDYSRYYPSYEAPAGFIASPVFDGDEKIGIVLFQLPIDRLNAIMGERSGMGETGETYLVGEDGLMRSDSYLDPENHSVVASFRNPDTGRVKTTACNQALSGKTGSQVIIDYNGNPVLSSYTPVHLNGFTWGLLAEIDVAEAFCPKDTEGKYFFEKYVELYGYYDLFLINPDGYCFYTVAKEADYQTNLLTGKFSDSNLGKLIRQVVDGQRFGMVDFAPYAPSNNDPASFIAQPVVNNGKTELIVALQLPLEAINNIMQKREGLGKTGETYLVGPDHLMRSDSFLDSARHSVKASFANPSAGSVKTLAAMEALGGKSGQGIIMDYNGNPVLSAYSPVTINHIPWALIAEIDEAEVVKDSVAAKLLSGRVWSIGIVSMIIVVCVILMSIFIVRNLSKTLLRVIDGLSSSTEQVASAASQVSSSSQSLAQGASEQAASIEETSSSMEEMSSMTRKNSDNAAHADGLMKEANQVVTDSNTAMGQLMQSMEDISKASEETSKIIKAIDEISFQTNLLALNAAVEAARAGEAGAGFAVVADEVRNLAMRAADAAKNTAGLIEGTVKKVNDGLTLVATANDAFSRVAKSTAKVGDIVSEIAEASKEQSNGIEQVNLAVTEMDKVIQQNAANAEESASASEEMNAQAEQLKEYVEDLVLLVTGKKDQGVAQRIHRDSGKKMPAPHYTAREVSPLSKAVSTRKAMIPSHHPGEVRPDRIIPFDEDGADF